MDDAAAISIAMSRVRGPYAADASPIVRSAIPSASSCNESSIDLDEPALIARARSDRRAFAPLYLAHYPFIVAHVHRRTGDAHTAQDIAAETFIRAMNGIARYQPRGLTFRHWLLRIATNETNRFLHRAGRRRLHERAAAHPDDAPRNAGSPDERAEHVQAALLKLRADHQAVIALHYFESLSVHEIARVLGCREGTVKSRLARAREALARFLGEPTEGTP